jgi:hypothetical protein
MRGLHGVWLWIDFGGVDASMTRQLGLCMHMKIRMPYDRLKTVIRNLPNKANLWKSGGQKMRMDETREYKGVYQTIVKFGCGSLGTCLKSTHPTYKYFESPRYFVRPV